MIEGGERSGLVSELGERKKSPSQQNEYDRKARRSSKSMSNE